MLNKKEYVTKMRICTNNDTSNHNPKNLCKCLFKQKYKVYCPVKKE